MSSRWDTATLDELQRRRNAFTQSWGEVIDEMRGETQPDSEGRVEAAARAVHAVEFGTASGNPDHDAWTWDGEGTTAIERATFTAYADAALAAADRWDRDHGIVRVDTRSDETVDAIGRAIADYFGDDYDPATWHRICAERVLAAAVHTRLNGEAQR